jgi:two-component system, chemotaxis family, protein-glutamate methylesterase/glutaminase
VRSSGALDETGQQRDLVVVGASAGGVQTLRRIVAGLPPELPAAVCIVLHMSPSRPSFLAGILHRAGPLPCRPAVDGEQLRAGEIVVAPPNRHLVSNLMADAISAFVSTGVSRR